MRKVNPINFLQWCLFGAAIFLFYKIYNGFTSVGSLFGISESENAANQVVNQVVLSPSKMTFTTQKAQQYAEDLYNSMFRWKSASPSYDGTDSELIFQTFDEIKNQYDMKAVYKSFGVRDYKTVMITNMLDLKGWLREELSNSELQIIQSKLNWI